MAVRYNTLECTQCASTSFKEITTRKNWWKCNYCGAEIERVEQYDGLLTIKNVVKQSILDSSYRRLDSSQKNLIECEKIDSRYIGTYIARIIYQMIVINTPGAYPQAEISNLKDQINQNYESLCTINKEISDEEEMLYEFFDSDVSSADIYAILLLVFDNLRDAKRRDYAEKLLKAEKVYAKETNKNLLGYAFRNLKYDLIDNIMQNPKNVDPGFAFGELLNKYPDNENKIKNIENLLKSPNFKPENKDKQTIENYLANSSDSLDTKGKIAVSAYSANIRVGFGELTTHLLSKVDSGIAEAILREICDSRLNDEEVYRILDFAVIVKSAKTATAVLTVLKETNQYVVMNSKYIITLLSRTDLTAFEKTEILAKTLDFNIDIKTKDAVINNYFCFNKDEADIRLSVIFKLLNTVSVIQTGTVENYILQVNADGENKPNIVERIFALELNMSFFHNLLTKYIESTGDSANVKEKIIAVLINKGLKIDPKILINYICFSPDSPENKSDLLKKMLANGVQLRSDTVNFYLESINSDSDKFDSELFMFILNSTGVISERALSNYLLNCRDRESRKVVNFDFLAKQCNRNIADISCESMCAGQKISGNILQIYVLATPDSFEVTKEICDYLIKFKSKLNAEIQTSIGFVKIKKFIAANINNLSHVSAQICAAYRID